MNYSEYRLNKTQKIVGATMLASGTALSIYAASKATTMVAGKTAVAGAMATTSVQTSSGTVIFSKVAAGTFSKVLLAGMLIFCAAVVTVAVVNCFADKDVE